MKIEIGGKFEYVHIIDQKSFGILSQSREKVVHSKCSIDVMAGIHANCSSGLRPWLLYIPEDNNFVNGEGQAMIFKKAGET